MKLKIRIRLGLAAEEDEILNIQANKVENLYPSQGLRVKYVGRQNFGNCGKALKCYWDEKSCETVAQLNICMQGRRQADFAI